MNISVFSTPNRTDNLYFAAVCSLMLSFSSNLTQAQTQQSFKPLCAITIQGVYLPMRAAEIKSISLLCRKEMNQVNNS